MSGVGPTDGPPQLGRYPIVDRLGAGGMGDVFSVSDVALGRLVAAKVLRDGAAERPGARERFVREARITGQLEHPHIVPVHELGRTRDGRSFFVMKRVGGTDLSQRLAQHRAGEATLSLADRLQIVLKVCDAVAFAHSRGVIHRDLKPANVMVGPYGEVVVCDWGLARRRAAPDAPTEAAPAGPPSAAPGATRDGRVMGTPAYMPPEQALGDHDRLDHRADIYALGAILHESLALQPPYQGRAGQVLLDVIAGKRVPPSRQAPDREIPWELDAVVERAMAAEPAERYPDVPALAADVRRYLDGRVLEAARYSPWQRLRKWIARNRAVSVAVLALVGVAGGLAGWRTWDARRARRAELSWARTQLSRHAAATRALRARWDADAALRRLGVAAIESLRQRATRTESLAAHLSLASRLERLLGQHPGDLAALALRREAGRRLGWLALISGDHTLAQRAFADLVDHGVPAAEVRALLDAVTRARTAGQAERARRLGEILADIRSGLARTPRPAGRPTLDDYLLEAVGFRDLATVTALEAELVGLAGRIRETAGRPRWVQRQRDTALFCCRLLGRLQLREAVGPLARWLAVVADEELAVAAGRALCRTGQPEARPPLLAARQRFGARSAIWRGIAPLSHRILDGAR